MFQHLSSSRRRSWIWTSDSARCKGSASLYIHTEGGRTPGQTGQRYRSYRDVRVCKCKAIHFAHVLLMHECKQNDVFSAVSFSCHTSQKPSWKIAYVIRLLWLVEFITSCFYRILDTNECLIYWSSLLLRLLCDYNSAPFHFISLFKAHS